MKAFEIHLNGRHFLTAGVGERGVLWAMARWVVGEPYQDERLSLLVQGADGVTDEDLQWSATTLGLGDELTIRFVEAVNVTPAEFRELFDPSAAGSDPRDLAEPMTTDAEAPPPGGFTPLEFDFLRSPP